MDFLVSVDNSVKINNVSVCNWNYITTDDNFPLVI